MKSQKVIKEVIKTEKVPQGQTKPYTSKKNSNSNASSNLYTVKETTFEKRYRRTFNKGGSSNKSEENNSSSLKQGTNSGSNFQNKIPVSNTEEKSAKNSTTSRNTYSEGLRYRRFKREIDKVIRIQKWWRRMLAILNGYKIRESLFGQNQKNYVVSSQKIVTETYSSEQNQNQNNPITIAKYLKSPQTNSYSSLYNLNNNQNSRSYTNIKNISTNINRDLNTTRLNTSSSMNYIRTMNKRIITQSSPIFVQSTSTSPSAKSKYIIETRKVEIFRKPKNLSVNRFVRETNLNEANSISNYEVKQMMRDIWNGETYCSTVESLCCLGDDVRNNVSQNTVIIEEYEEEIKRLKNMLMKKDDELNTLMRSLNETNRELNVNITKNMRAKNYYGQRNLDQDAHELQIISMKQGWNDVNIPSPVNEIYIESIENKIPPRMQYIEGMQIMGDDKMRNMERWSQKIRTEESIQESVSDPEAVLEIQEMNALSIISSKIRPKNMCQHLQSLMILSKRNEESEEYSVNIKEKEEKTGIEIIPIEKEPLVFQKIEQINIRCKPKPRKPRNQIQELDGLEIINYQRPKIELKRKVKPRYLLQNVDKICIQSLYEKEEEKIERRNLIIQELDGIEIIKAGKEPLIPQCVDELEVMREYDMLLVKPTWNSLQIQGSGLNLLAIPRDMGLENQEVDEFEILGLEKPELYVQSLEKITFQKPKVIQKKQVEVLKPLPQNSIEALETFEIKGIKKKPEIKTVEKVIIRDSITKKEIAPNEISISNQFLIKGRKKSDIKKISKVDRIAIKGKEKIDYKDIVYLDELIIEGKEKIDDNRIIKVDKFKIQGIKQKPKVVKEVKVVEKVKEEKVEEKEEEEEKEPEEYFEENVVEISILSKQKKIMPNVVRILERFRLKGSEKRIEPYVYEEVDGIELLGEEMEEKEEEVVEKKDNEINNLDNFRFSGKVKEDNKINNRERFRYSAILREPNQIIKMDRFKIYGINKPKEDIVPVKRKGFVEKINKTEIKKKTEEKSEEKKEEKKILVPDRNESLVIHRAYMTNKEQKIVTREFTNIKIGQKTSLRLYGIPTKKKKILPVKEIRKSPTGEKEVIVEKIIEKDWNEFIYPSDIEEMFIKRAYEKVKIPQQQIIQKQEIKKPIFEIERKEEKSIVGIEKKPVVEETKTVEKVVTVTETKEQRNWNDEIKPIKSTKLFIEGEHKMPIIQNKIISSKIVKEKEKEEFDIESFAHNLIGTGRKFQDLHIENGGFDLEGNKGMILKEGPAETIKITKEQVLIPTQISQFTLKTKIPKKKVENVEKVEKVEIIEEDKTWSDLIRPSRGSELFIKQKIKTKEVKPVKENKLFINGIRKKPVQQVYFEKKKDINWNIVNRIKREGTVKFLYNKQPVKIENGEKIQTIEKIVEKIVEVEKEIDWNKFNEIDKKDDINLLYKKKEITLEEKRTNSFSLIGVQVEKIVQKIEKTEKKDYCLQAQKNAKFALYGKQKLKKYKLIVANGDNFFIQKESDDEIIYNDDYNSRREKKELKAENEGEQKTQVIKEKEIIREKEYIPRIKREIRAQISRLKESESSETSSNSEIDVLAGIKKKKIAGYAAASGEADAAFAKYRKSGDLSGYHTRIISGEVVFTAKNGLGVNLGGSQYQKMHSTMGYTKRLSEINGNKMSGIEISLSPEMKNEMLFQKMTGASGAIADGNYTIIGSKKIITTNKGLLGSTSCKEMKVMNRELHATKSEADLGKNGQQSYRKQIIITTKTEDAAHNDLNGQAPLSTRVVFNNRTLDTSKNDMKRKDSQKSENSKNSKNSKNSINSKNSKNSKNIQKVKESTNTGNNPFLRDIPNSEISQQMKSGKVVFNSRLKTDNSHSSSPAGNDLNNKAITSRQEYEMKIKSNGNQGNEKIVTERKKVEVKFKNGKKTKNVEPLRDFESQNNF